MKLIFATLAATLAGSTAFAGGFTPPVVEQPVAAPVAPVAPVDTGADWTGGYVGLQYGKGDVDVDRPDITFPSGLVDPAESRTVDVDGYGIHGGYLHDLGKFVVGGEVDFNKLDNDDGDVDMWRLRGRAGYDLGRWLPYASLGMARLSADDESENGVTYGVGVDYKVTDNFTIGAEYTWQQFDLDETEMARTVGVLESADYTTDVDVDLIQIRGAYHF